MTYTNHGIYTYPSLLPEHMNLASVLQVTLKTRPESNTVSHFLNGKQA